MSRRLLWSLAAILLLVSRSAMCAPSCAEIRKNLAPCVSYLQGSEPSRDCCAGFKEVIGEAKTQDDRETICTCGKAALSNFKYDPNRIPPLPQKCGLTRIVLPPIDSNTDCTKITHS
ncbi:non-specific lipid-transfer protein-like [Cornus florida]|uniref:non-specific lipid-transfer protein-like n=1 Tax=Cornus florida TaxID=4283 RepID=UPI0028A122A6|nr:non-specific lipid-transfer protein-like [Cornus florida]